MTRTILVQTATVTTKSGAELTKQFVGTSWNPKKMMASIKEEPDFPVTESGKKDSIKDMSVKTDYMTLSMSDELFYKTALAEMQN